MLVFAIVSIALFMASMDQTIVATALTTLQHDLGASINWTGWTITIYSLGQIVAMPLAGKISDMYGRKKVFLLAAVLFTASSLCCGLVDNIYLLVFFRALQALGGGAFMPSATGIVSDLFGDQRDRALGMFTSIFPIGGIIGPIAGGLFVTYASWREIFLVNVPIGIALLVLGVKFIPASRPRSTSRMDVRGVALLAALILVAMFGISSLGSSGYGVFLVCEAAALGLGWLFVRHTKRDKAPFIPIQLLRGRGFGVMNLINLLFGIAALGLGTLVPVYAEQRYGISALESGTLLTARAVGTICVAGLAVFALRRTGSRLPITVGFAIVAAGLCMMFFPPAGMSAYLWLAIAAGITGVGMGLSVPATNNATLQLAPDQVAAIAGLRGMFRQSGSIVAVSAVTALLARSADPGMTQAYILIVFAAVLICVLPLVRLIPDHRGSW